MSREEVNFRIVENPTPVFLERFDEFVELYNSPNVSVSEIRSRLGWNFKHYSDARLKALDEGLIVNRKHPKKEGVKKEKVKPKYYSRSSETGRFIVVKYLNKKNVFFGSYLDEEVAKVMVEELMKVDWDVDLYPSIKERVLNEYY